MAHSTMAQRPTASQALAAHAQSLSTVDTRVCAGTPMLRLLSHDRKAMSTAHTPHSRATSNRWEEEEVPPPMPPPLRDCSANGSDEAAAARLFRLVREAPPPSLPPSRLESSAPSVHSTCSTAAHTVADGRVSALSEARRERSGARCEA